MEDGGGLVEPILLNEIRATYIWFSFTHEKRDWCVGKRRYFVVRVLDHDRQRGRTAQCWVSAILTTAAGRHNLTHAFSTLSK